MHTSILKLVYMHIELLHVMANHVAIFKDVEYKGQIHLKFNVYWTVHHCNS